MGGRAKGFPPRYQGLGIIGTKLEVENDAAVNDWAHLTFVEEVSPESIGSYPR